MQGPPATQFWGKLHKGESDQSVEWHPLIDHCADVAACLEALLAQPVIRRRLATLAGIADVDEMQCARLCVFGALHDVGKFSLGFQSHAWPNPRPQTAHVGPALHLLLHPDSQLSDKFRETLPHKEIKAWGSRGVARNLWAAAIAHHGKPVPQERPDASNWQTHAGLDPFEGLAMLSAKARAWWPAAFADGGSPLPTSSAFQHAFSGLVMLADWLGSSRAFFPYTKDAEAATDRIGFARDRALESLERIGIAAGPARLALGVEVPSFANLFGFAPRDAQSKTMQLPVHAKGSVTILESETGSGKTEAALARYIDLFHRGEVDGLYFALPTRSAATQLRDRVHKFVSRAFPEHAPSVTLAVPGYLLVDDTEGQRLADFETLWHDEDRERWRYRGWAAENSKRYLAGPIVVGTIDQVLLSALAVGHAHLRAAALLRHLLVIDEVHASDAYMTRLTMEVLKRHSAAGGHALLMSATLGAMARAPLLGVATPSFDDAIAVPYPVVTDKPIGRVPTLHPIRNPGSPKAIRVSCDAVAGDAMAVAGAALSAAREGARVIILRNTVRECVETQRALEGLNGSQAHLFRCRDLAAPHHARFSKADRTALDEAVGAVFGRGAQGPGVVLVATQTIQQSLDLDADLMLTDLCPMDVLLQRLGRLHRHAERRRPLGYAEARAIVLVPEGRDLAEHLRRDGQVRGPHGYGTVYEDLRILEATWRQLVQHPVLRIPEMNRRLVEETTHHVALERIVKELGGEWQTHESAIVGRYYSHRQIAGNNTFDWSKELMEQAGVFADEKRKPSRLGEQDRRVEFAAPVRGPFGAVRALSIPSWLAQGASDEERPEQIVVEPGGFAFGFGSKRFRYDRLGLRRLEVDAELEDQADA